MVKLNILTYREEDRYLAICPEMDAVAYGDTKEQAIRRLRASLFFFIKETGYTISDTERIKILQNEGIYFIENYSKA